MSASCRCAVPRLVELPEYTLCDACHQTVHGSEVFASNFTDLSAGAPNKIYILDCAAASAESDEPKRKKLPFKRWNGISKVVRKIQGQHSADYTKNWAATYRKVISGLQDAGLVSNKRMPVRRELRDIPYNDFYFSISDRKLRKEAPILWESITGNKLPVIPDFILWVIEHVICARMYELDMAHYLSEDSAVMFHRLMPGAVLSRVVRMWGLREVYPFLDVQLKCVSKKKLDEYWSLHVVANRWKEEHP
jgi:hypothetical protein